MGDRLQSNCVYQKIRWSDKSNFCTKCRYLSSPCSLTLSTCVNNTRTRSRSVRCLPLWCYPNQRKLHFAQRWCHRYQGC